MSKKRGRPRKSEAEKKDKVLPVRMKPDFYDRIKSFSELTGYNMAEILRRGAANFINDWHTEKQNSYEAEND